MVVLNRDGSFIRSWGEGLFRRAHGLHIDADDNLYCTDDGDHTVRKCSTDGKVLLTIGIPDKPAPYMSGEPFNRCTHTALSPKGEIYVSDGYGNACVHKYTPDGKLMKTWGEPGSDPGPVQHRAQHRGRRGRLGLRGGPREPSRAGVRRQRQVRDAVEQPAPALRAVLLRRQEAELHHRRARARHAGQPAFAESRAAPDHRGRAGQARRAARRRERAGPGDRKIPRPARHRARLQGRHLSGRGRRDQLEDELSRIRRCRRWCGVCRSWKGWWRSLDERHVTLHRGGDAERTSTVEALRRLPPRGAACPGRVASHSNAPRPAAAPVAKHACSR